MKQNYFSGVFFISLLASTMAVDSLEYIALKRIEKHKKPRIIQVPIYTVKQSLPPVPKQIAHVPEETRRFPLYVPM